MALRPVETDPEKMARNALTLVDNLRTHVERMVGDDRDKVGGIVGPQIEDIKKGVDELLGRIAKIEERKAKGQPNWMTVRDPGLAGEWLQAVASWHDDIYCRLEKGAGLPECWPWHPVAVVNLLALFTHYVNAYKSSAPAAVLDLYGRYWPDARSRMTGELDKCRGGAHQQDGREWGEQRRSWKVDRGEIPAFVQWWTGNQQGRPPGLTPA
jgi:hypothetical protein